MDNIILLNPSDIISESMNKINHNFEIISASEDVTDYKISQFTKQYQADLAELKELYNSKDLEILDNINSLSDRITNIPSLDNLQDAIEAAITGTAESLENFIMKTAGAQIENSLSGYAKTSDLQDDYVSSAAFTEYKSNADERTASISSIVGNSQFLKDESGHYIYGKSASGMNPLYRAFEDAVAGAPSNYTSIKEIFDAFVEYGEEDVLGEGDSDDSDYEISFDDPKVVAKLIAICEKTFRTVATELSSVEQIVAQGISRTSIVNALNRSMDPDAEGADDVVAAIFMEANERGSEIVLNADQIKLDANHKLELNTGEFSINSNNFIVTPTGHVEASDIVLNTANGNTSIDSNGILHAHGAEIDGNITADKFSATNVEDNLTRTTIMNGTSFNIIADGTVTDGGTNIPVSGNALYISIEKEIANQEGSNIDGEKLYGVPVLCMRYNGVDYVLSPASWISKSVSADTSNIRWIPRYTLVNYSLYNLDHSYYQPINTVISGSGNSGTYYIFKNSADCIRNNSSKTSVTQVQVLDLGNVDLATNRSWFTDLATDTTSVEKINETAACAINVPSIYVNEGIGTRTEISADTCATYSGFLSTVFSGGVEYQLRNILTSFDSGTPYGISNIYNFIENTCGVSDNSEGQSYWKLKNIESESNYNIVKIDNKSILKGLMPFGGNNASNKAFDITLDYYPEIEVTNKGKNLRDGVNLIWVKCNVSVTSSGYTNKSVDYTIVKHVGIQSSTDSGTFNIGSMTFNFSFNFVLNFNNAITGFNPLDSDTKSQIDGKIDLFLTQLQFDNITNPDNYLSFEAVINDGNNSRLVIDSFESYKEDN